ncbi:MAG: carbohydrate binding family 9 domain-containing protein, partial [Gemmatimonadales bacterium]|nr:carbohydrate binding family 9 domain-containing protein [Gemmatimonadales bacterium]
MAPLLGTLFFLQAQSLSAAPPLPTATTVQATRTAVAPVLDGRDVDAVWISTPAVDQFLEARPSEGAAPKLRTEARVAYDARNLYVFVRAFDPHPDSIVSLLSRRDDQTASDYVTLMLDPYHDRRTGYEFSVNPAGVKSDYAIYGDGDEDVAWDAVWDAATRIDSLGWTAEYRIPLSQLRYSSKGGRTFGLLIWRVIQRHTASVTWPLYRTSRSGLASQFGELRGLEGLGSPGQAEITPYVVTKNVVDAGSADFNRDQQISVGGDLRYRVASNLLLNATANPDFGQVEADPSELNLSAFETFFSERRPFFVEGKGLFTFTVNCVVVVDCETGEGLFYSRRIGRSPQLAGTYGDAGSPTSTRILGAAKVTGRLPGGFSLGVLDAVTDHVAGPGGTTLEPPTNYAVVRGNQDFRGGDASVGFILTGVNRSLDPSGAPHLHRSAYTGGVDARWRFRGRFEVSGSLDLSRVGGDPAAIARTQRDPVHLYQRPDGPLTFDSTRTSLSGANQEIRFAKVGGKRLRFETAY